MDWNDIYIALSFLGAMASFFILAFSAPYHRRPMIFYFMLITALISLWCFSSFFRVLSQDLNTAFYWHNLLFFGSAFSPPVFLLFLLAYLNRLPTIAPRWRWFLFVVPTLVQFAAWTDQDFHLFHKSIQFEHRDGVIVIVDWQPGLFFFIHTFHGYFLILCIFSIIIWQSVKRNINTKEMLLLLSYVILPLIASLIYTFKLVRVSQPITPIAFFLANLLLAYDLFWGKQLSLLPLIRAKVMSTVEDAIGILNDKGYLVDCNQAFKRLTGCEPLPGKGGPLYQRPGNAAALAHFLQETEARGNSRGSWSAQVDGMTFYYDVKVSALQERNWKGPGAIIVLRDITESRQLLHELEHTNKELEASNAELDAYAHTVAHDLKAPLHSMQGLLTLLQAETEHDQDLQMQVKMLAGKTQVTSGIIHELLLLSQIRKAAAVETRMLEMGQLFELASNRLEHEITEKSAAIKTPDHWEAALGYEPWVIEVWVNYLNNALKYGGPQSTIEAGSTLLPGGQVRYWLRDDGPGIPLQDQPDLFQKFSKLNHKAEGQGLGLSIVKRIVERLGGEVGVESSPGQGAEFYFTLPVQTKHPEQEAAQDVS